MQFAEFSGVVDILAEALLALHGLVELTPQPFLMFDTPHPNFMFGPESVLEYFQSALLSIFEVLLSQFLTSFLVLFNPLHLFHPTRLQLSLYLLVICFDLLSQFLLLI
jgi:hypothetical protein